MIRRPRGRRASNERRRGPADAWRAMEAGRMRSSWTCALVLAVAMAVTLGGGCKKKGPQPGEAGANAGLGEEGLAGGSSLERAKRGMSPEEDGLLTDVHFAYDSAEL